MDEAGRRNSWVVVTNGNGCYPLDMIRPPESDPPIDKVVLLVLTALFLFASPLIFWWTDSDSVWYLPYLLWLLIIGVGAWVFTRSDGGRDES